MESWRGMEWFLGLLNGIPQEALIKDEEGRWILANRAANVGSEIQERLMAGVELQVTKRLFQAMGDGVIITGADGSIQSVNPAFTSVTGYTQQEVIGKNPRFLQSGFHESSFYKSIWGKVRETGKWQGEIWNKRKTGELYQQAMTLCSVKSTEGFVTNYIAVLRDITEQEKIRKDVQMTGDLQRKFLPPDLENEWFAITGVFQPAQYVSGDLYDYLWDQESGKLFGYVMDMMGHGLATALQMSALRVLFRQAAAFAMPLRDKLTWINNEAFRYFAEDTFAAVICFEIDFPHNKLVFASGGINHFLTGRDNRIRKIQVEGSFIGLHEHEDYAEHTMTIHSGDYLLFLSDGMMDILDDSSLHRFSDIETLLGDLHRFAGGPKQDDATALCVRCMGKAIKWK